MIKTLKISNYALIEQLEIDFISGFITITGETGAGKSILMGALSLILGQRADTTALLDKERKCIIEGNFILGDTYQEFFKKNDLDYDEESIIRREIMPGGKSRAFINDSPVNLSVMKALGDQLVDIHSQHQNLKLNDHTYQLMVVDFVAENETILKEYQDLYQQYKSKKQDRQKLEDEISRISGELDFYQFQYKELDAAKLSEQEYLTLEEELDQLENAEEIMSALARSSNLIDGDHQILALLNEALHLQRKISSFYKHSGEFADRLNSAHIELKDLASEMSRLAEDIEHDPGKLEQSKARLDLYLSLLQKHRVKEVHELIDIRNKLEEKIAAITFSDDHLKSLDREIEVLLDQLHKLGNKLHENREASARVIEEKVAGQLKELGIPNAAFQVKVEGIDAPRPDGMDDVRFLFSANKQSRPEEVSKVASGGEVSRLMLSIKALLSNYQGLPTLIFDEIDAGVSGEIAEKMGSIMKSLSDGRQVIAITHLPQVASLGSEHFLVYKEDEGNATVTRIRLLNKEERITEIAKLLSGERISEAAISNAKELLKV